MLTVQQVAKIFELKSIAADNADSQEQEKPRFPVEEGREIGSLSNLSEKNRIKLLSPINLNFGVATFYWDPRSAGNEIRVFDCNGKFVQNMPVRPLFKDLKSISHTISKIPFYIINIVTLGLINNSEVYDLWHQRVNASATIRLYSDHMPDYFEHKVLEKMYYQLACKEHPELIRNSK